MLPFGRHYGALLLDLTPKDVVDLFEVSRRHEAP